MEASAAIGLAQMAARVAELQQRFAPPTGFAEQLRQQVDATAPARNVTPLPGALDPASASPGPTADATLVMPTQGRLTSAFGPRIHPISGSRSHHDGIDIAAPTGAPIVAGAPGTVTFAGPRGGYGNLVIVDHGGGLETRYAHAERVEVGVGQTVAAGQLLATVGSTGRSTGPHLHFEVRRDGTPVEPQAYLNG